MPATAVATMPSSIESATAVDYKWTRYGGWGIRRGRDGEWLYNMPGDGGKAVRCLATVRPHEKLTGRTHLHDIYDKSGRSGRMIFLVSRMELFNEQEQKLAMSDARMILREKSS